MSWRFALNAQDSVAQEFGWQFNGTNANGHRTYGWNAPDGTQHMVVGYGNHQGDPTQDAKKLRRLMMSCQNGTCAHINLPPEVPLMDEPGAPVIRPGTQVSYGNGRWWVMDVDGGLAHIYDAAGQEDIVPEQELKVASRVPDWVFASHVVKRSVLEPYRPAPESWVPIRNRVMPAEWSAFNDSPERDVCPFCGGDMHDINHSHDYCKVLHRRVAAFDEDLSKNTMTREEWERHPYKYVMQDGTPAVSYYEPGTGTVLGPVKFIEDMWPDKLPWGDEEQEYYRTAGREWEELPRFQEHPDCPHCHRDALHFQYDEEGRPYVECAACEHQFMQDSGDGQLHDMTQGGGDWQALPDDEPTGELWPDFMPADWH